MTENKHTSSEEEDRDRPEGEDGTQGCGAGLDLNAWMPGPLEDESLTGDEPLKDLVSQVEVELQALARRMRRGFSPPPSLETVELVGEMYVRLFDGKVPTICDRNHFFSIAARTMRWILVGRHQQLRPEILGDLMPATEESSTHFDLEALNGALEELAAGKPEMARLVDLAYFLGLAPSEIAEIVQSSERIVFRDLKRARAWLYWRLGEDSDSAEGSS